MRIGGFVATGRRVTNHQGSRQARPHRVPAILRVVGHRSDSGQHQSASHSREGGYGADAAQPGEIVQRLTAARRDLTQIGQLTDQQLDSVPPKDSFRFCDGQRTLEQVLAGLLKHQDHQVQTLKLALAQTR
jgi:hypothetical protein